MSEREEVSECFSVTYLVHHTDRSNLRSKSRSIFFFHHHHRSWTRRTRSFPSFSSSSYTWLPDCHFQHDIISDSTGVRQGVQAHPSPPPREVQELVLVLWTTESIAAYFFSGSIRVATAKIHCAIHQNCIYDTEKLTFYHLWLVVNGKWYVSLCHLTLFTLNL